MEKSGFFNSVNGDRKYKAGDFAEYFASFIGNGVFPNPSNNLQIVSNNNMTVTLKKGYGWINGYIYMNTDDLILNIDVADGVLNRIDKVVLRMDTVGRNITAKVKKGTFASSPVAPALQRNADAYELALADIYVAKGSISISQANITDLRLNKELCGVVHGTIDQVDVTTVFNQYTEGFKLKEEEFRQQFNTWFDSVKSTLSGDTAGNLLNMINGLAGSGRTTETIKGVSDALTSHKADYVAQPANAGTTGGTSTAYTITTNPTPASLVDKIGAVFTVHADSGANPTLQWGTLAVKPIKKPNGNAAVLKKDGVYTVRYNATTGNFILQGEGGSGNATASDLLSGKTASTDAGDIVGTMPNRGLFNLPLGATVPAGYYSGGTAPNGKRWLTGTVMTQTSTLPGGQVQNGFFIQGFSFTPSVLVLNYTNNSGEIVQAIYTKFNGVERLIIGRVNSSMSERIYYSLPNANGDTVGLNTKIFLSLMNNCSLDWTAFE